MIVFRVSDVQTDECLKSNYDLAIFAAGYEERCTNLASQIDLSGIRRSLLVGFAEHAKGPQRAENSRLLQRLLRCSEVQVAHDDERPLLDALRQMPFPPGGNLSILVDYSSMSRSWYSGVISFFRYLQIQSPVSLTFAYTVGEHQDLTQENWTERSNYSVEEIISLRGLEGGPLRPKSTVALLGLGFEWLAPISVCEQLEPDVVYPIVADPGAFPEYGPFAVARNREFLQDYTRNDNLVRAPIRSVATTYRLLAELVLPFRQDSNIVLVPMGPKPHVLASILLANRFRELSCLYVKGARKAPIRVRPAAPKDIVATRVELIPDP